jgi:hypothetical protein
LLVLLQFVGDDLFADWPWLASGKGLDMQEDRLAAAVGVMKP